VRRIETFARRSTFEPERAPFFLFLSLFWLSAHLEPLCYSLSSSLLTCTEFPYPAPLLEGKRKRRKSFFFFFHFLKHHILDEERGTLLLSSPPFLSSGKSDLRCQQSTSTGRGTTKNPTFLPFRGDSLCSGLLLPFLYVTSAFLLRVIFLAGCKSRRRHRAGCLEFFF